ncbi:MAG TPA: hypothetical protein VFX11_00635 [Candidatus Kapabacteria bacterium]|nr:hypothetical protein [Candidatus Kapabacteria bacterium]
MSGHYMSFEATVTLRRDAETFIANIQRGERASQSLLLQQVLDAFVNQCLQVFFLAPADVAGLSPVSRKLLTSAIATIRKTLQLVLGRITRKLGNREMRPLALFMDEVMFRERNRPDGVAFIAFELEDDLSEQLRQLQRACRAGHDDVTDAMVTAFQSMAEEGITRFFAEPVATLNLGPVLGKIAEMGVDTTRSVTSTLIRRLFVMLTHEQMAAVVEYFCGMITDEAPDVQTPVVDQVEWA